LPIKEVVVRAKGNLMNFEALKSGFISYLTEKLEGNSGQNSEEVLKDSDISIFEYSSEFKDYLVEEVGADVSIFSKSLNEIMNMDLVNGKLVSNDDNNSDSFQNNNIVTDVLNEAIQDKSVINLFDTDKSGDLNKEELNIFLKGLSEDGDNISFDKIAQTTQDIQEKGNSPQNKNPETSVEETPKDNVKKTESSDNITNRLLEKVYNDKAVIKTLDLDGDGKLSGEEKAKFEEFIKGYDGDTDGELSEADIKRAFDDIKDGKFSYDSDLSKRAEEIDKKVEQELADKAEKAAAPSSQGNVGNSFVGGTTGSSNSFSDSNAVTGNSENIENMSLEKLEETKNEKQEEINTARDDINKIYSGENPAVKQAEDDCKTAKEAYDEAVKNDEKISDELKQKREDNLNAIEEQENEIDTTKTNINNTEAKISEQTAIIAEDDSNIQALEAAQSALQSQTSDDPEKQAEITAKLAEIQTSITEAKNKKEKDEATLKEYEDTKKEYETNLETQEAALTELENEKSEIEAQILANCSEETKEAMQAYNDAKTNVETVKNAELKTANEKISSLQSELDNINEQINIKKAEEIKKENSVSDFDFNFDLNLSDIQENELEAFKKNWEQNKDKYEAVEEATGMPAELVAAIHWREGSGNFNTYLHNGQQLGQTTTIVPEGIYFEDWTEAAIDAVSNYGTPLSSIDPNNIETYYDYAEHYNGMGYHNKGLPSPYVWAGTSNYEKGKYVADGQFDPNHVDQQLGVAVMLRTLLE